MLAQNPIISPFNAHRKPYRTTVYTLFLLMAGSNIPAPLYQLFSERWPFSPLTLTLLFAVYAFVLIPGLPLFGLLSDRFGRKRILLAGIAFSLASSALYVFAQGLGWLFAGRLLQGIAVGLMSGTASAALVELHPSGNRKAAALASSLASAGGTALGPLLAGLLAQFAPWPTVTPFVLYFVLLLIGGSLLLPWRESRSSRPEQESGRRSARTSIMPRGQRLPFALAALTSFHAWSVTALFMSVVPAYASVLLPLRGPAFAGVLVFLMLAASVVSQLLARRLAARRAMHFGLLLLAAGVAALVAAIDARNVPLFLLCTVICGAGMGLAFMGSLAAAGELAPADRRGSALSLLYAVAYLGVSVPIVGLGLAALRIGMTAALWGFAGFISVTGLAISAGLWIQSKHRTQSALMERSPTYEATEAG